MSLRAASSRRLLAKTVVAFSLLAGVSDPASPALAGGNGALAGKVSAAVAQSLEETVVYVKSAPGASAAAKATVDQKGMKFIPHLLAITAGDSVEYQNHDGVDHNVFSPDNEGYNLGTFKPSETRTYTFKKDNVSYRELCSVHPEMLGYVFVGQNRFHAVVGADGSFTIQDLPPGDYQVAVWNPKLKAPDQSVRVAAAGTTTVSFSIK